VEEECLHCQTAVGPGKKSISTVPSISFLLFPQQHVVCLSAVFHVNVLCVVNCKYASSVRFMLSEFKTFAIFFNSEKNLYQ